MISESFHIVLVEPQESLNVGSVARAMSNMGFKKLHLVAPRNYTIEKARITACHGTDVLEQLEIHDTLETCLAGMQMVVGFSGQHGQHRPSHVMLDAWKREWEQAPCRVTALVFGPEDTGLRIEHLAHCRWTVRIPSSCENPSLNLAQAVLVVLYELQRDTNAQISASRERAPGELQYQLERIVQELLDRCGFYRPGTPAPIPELVKNLLRRIEPDPREMGVLLALFSRVNMTVKRLTGGGNDLMSAGKVPESQKVPSECEQ